MKSYSTHNRSKMIEQDNYFNNSGIWLSRVVINVFEHVTVTQNKSYLHADYIIYAEWKYRVRWGVSYFSSILNDLLKWGILTPDCHTVSLDPRSSLNDFKWGGNLLICNTNDQRNSHFAINSEHILIPFLHVTPNSLNQCQWQDPWWSCLAARWKQLGKGEREI